jgi:enterochelin esterase-like enzyme
LYARRFNELFDLFFFSTGTEESNFYEQNLRTVQHLKELGIDITYFETPGYHDWQVWRHSFRAFVTKLFRPFSSCNSFE